MSMPADARLAYAYVRRFDLMLRAPMPCISLSRLGWTRLDRDIGSDAWSGPRKTWDRIEVLQTE